MRPDDHGFSFMSDLPASRVNEPSEAARREPVFNLPWVVVLLIAACVTVYVIEFHFLSDRNYFIFLANAAFIPIRYNGQFDLDITAFTSPLTYAFLHGSIAHLAINMIWLAAFGSPLANRLGVVRFLIFWAVTSVCAVGLHYVLHMLDQSPLVGASGAISGMMGAAARFGFRIDRSSGRAAFTGAPLSIPACLRSRSVMTFLLIWMAVNLVTGLVAFAPGVDDKIAWEAHIGGFLAGFLGIGLIDRRPTRPEVQWEDDEAASDEDKGATA